MTKQWRELRAAKLRAEPLCERCKANGYIVSAHCVHHIVPVESAVSESDQRALAYSWANLMSLCDRCHKEVHDADGKNSRQNRRQREAERMERWKERHEAAVGKSMKGLRDLQM